MLFSFKRRPSAFAAATVFSMIMASGQVLAEVQLAAFVTAPVFSQALATAAASDASLSNFYRSRNYEPLWTGAQDAARRQLLLQALDTAALHGLPVARYDAAALRDGFRAALTEADRGRLELAMTTAYLAFAQDISSGVLVAAMIDSTIKREVTPPSPALPTGPRCLTCATGPGLPSAR